ncbi:hypothetical protein K9U39_01755 [Rhodoblastus acidophilus]|uniref:MarR family transcriptional regulator n=2 Tax=Candidatus Rhodoblastus alkanivorans TaxID=2954117 RepID=A0ABS9Z421_9HYPH|nr:hypothetical protein [Candidatus Rhodoblastus alkanivorans]MCI4682373.1 hypothetical protein [Candidatus Rhodoblastus alkanivorans]MDI4639676.1 hypothetical protein [Rhodoblastus acidophilus]
MAEAGKMISSDPKLLMRQTRDAISASPPRAGVLLADVDKFLRRVENVERKFDLAADELLILLTLGRLGLSVSMIGVAVRPVRCIEVAKRLKAPKETVRRKLTRLIDLGFATMTKRGVVLDNIDDWVKVAFSIVS